jgi:hypothetical protein
MANYLERISKDAKEKDVASKKAAAEKAAINVQAAVFQAKSEVNEAKQALDAAASIEPFSVNDYLDAEEALEVATKTFESLKKMNRELFAGLIETEA